MPASAKPATAAGQLAAIAKRSNSLYQAWSPVWQKLAHVREGTGGFQDGTYLVAHPREYVDHSVDQVSTVDNGDGTTRQIKTKVPNPNARVASPKLLRRRQLARYENFAGKIIDQIKAALFREDPTRRVGKDEKANAPLAVWWQNIDRKTKPSATMPIAATAGPVGPTTPVQGTSRTSINKFWTHVWDAAATFGHMFVVMDRPKGAPAVTAADQSSPFLRMYTPLDAIDWLTDDLGNLTAIMFVEVAPRASLGQVARVDYNLRVFTTEYWGLYDANYNLIEGGPDNGQHKFGRIPVVVLYSKRRNLVPMIGHSVLDDPQLYIDLYNLTSELRELLRNQTFSMLNVQLGDNESVLEAQANLGQMSGTESVLFSKGKADFISGDAGNVEAYRKERADLVRAIYRLAAIAWESDSKDAEAHGSLKLKREDLNQMLSAFADELEHAELEVAELFYRAQHGPDAWEQRFLEDGVVVRYPETFDPTPFDVILAQAEAALALDMPPTFNKELKKRLVPKFLPELPPTQLEAINKEIDAGLTEPSPMERRLAARMAAATPGSKDANAIDQQTIDGTKNAQTTDGSMRNLDQAAA